MSVLPVNNGEYQKIVIMTDFIARMRGFFEHEKLKKYKFSPQPNGYEITFEYKNCEAVVKIEYKKKSVKKSVVITEEIKNRNGNTIRKKHKAKSAEDNEAVVRQIIADCG